MNYYKEILKLIEVFSKNTSIQKNAEYALLTHLIMLYGESDFNSTFKVSFIDTEGEFGAKFHDFHKMMRQVDFYNISDFEGNGHLDMIFWNFIHISNVTETIFKAFLEFVSDWDYEHPDYESLIGKRVTKRPIGEKNLKGYNPNPFKSGFKVNTVKSIINHPILNVPAFTFEEDDSFVECRRCAEYKEK